MTNPLSWSNWLALASYYTLTLPLRAWQARMRALAGRAPVMVIY